MAHGVIIKCGNTMCIHCDINNMCTEQEVELVYKHYDKESIESLECNKFMFDDRKRKEMEDYINGRRN